MKPAAEKLRNKAMFSPYCGDKTRLCHGMWLLHLSNILKIQVSYLTFPLAESIAAESIAEAFCRLFLWNFKEKASTISQGTA